MTSASRFFSADTPLVAAFWRIYRWFAAHPQLALWLVLILGLALRLWRLTAQDLWWDEGDSAWQAPMSLHEIALYQARDQHPPLYYWLLHGWYLLTGSSLFALRFFSVVWSTLGLAVAYALGYRLLHSRWIALAGVLLLALSRFQVEWSQEIKMYAMTTTLSMLSLLLAIHIWQRKGLLEAPPGDRDRPHALLWAGYLLATLAAVYSHYIALVGLAAQNGLMLILLLRARRWRFALPWALAQLAAVAGVVPWFLLHAQHTSVWQPEPARPLAETVRMVATLLSVGTSLNVERYTALTLLLWLPPLATLWPRRQANRPHGILPLWLMLLVPLLLIYVLTLPVFGLGYEAKLAARFFLLCQTPYSLLLATGLASLRRVHLGLPLIGLLAVIGLLAGPLSSYLAGRYPQDGYTTLARTIQALARRDEAVLLLNDAEWPTFHYAYQGTLPYYHVPYRAVGGEALIEPYVAPAWEQHAGLWVVTIPQAQSQDPQQAVIHWLEQQGQVLLDERYGERRLLLIRKTPRELTVGPDDGYKPQHPLNRPLIEGLTLVGYDQALDEVRTGRSLRVVSVWQGNPPQGVQVQAVLVDRQGQELGAPSDPVALAAGATRVRSDLPISTAVPSGRYHVRLVLLGEGGERRTMTELGPVHVVRTMQPVVQAAQYSVSYRLGEGIALQGYDLGRAQYRPGEDVALTLYWHAIQKGREEYTVFVHILGTQTNPRTDNPLWGQVDRLPMEGKYPTSAWLAGDTIRDSYIIPLDPDTPPGDYILEIGLYSPHTGQRLPVFDAEGQPLGDRILLTPIIVH